MKYTTVSLIKKNTVTNKAKTIISGLMPSYAAIRNYLDEHEAHYSHGVGDNPDEHVYSVFVSDKEPGIEYHLHVITVDSGL